MSLKMRYFQEIKIKEANLRIKEDGIGCSIGSFDF